jgi:outer membrane protein assembly factor BamB
VLRLDAEGDAAWRRLASPIAPDGVFEARAAARAASGDVLVAAYGAPAADEPGGIWVLRFDQGGTDRAQTVIDEADDEHPEALAAFADGGVAVAGWTLAVSDGNRAPKQQAQAWMVRLDASGHIAWDHRWPGGPGRIEAVAALDDGGVVVAGQVAGAGLLARLDDSGKTVWEWRRHGAALHALTLLPDGMAAAAGDRHNRMWVVRFAY